MVCDLCKTPDGVGKFGQFPRCGTAKVDRAHAALA